MLTRRNSHRKKRERERERGEKDGHIGRRRAIWRFWWRHQLRSVCVSYGASTVDYSSNSNLEAKARGRRQVTKAEETRERWVRQTEDEERWGWAQTETGRPDEKLLRTLERNRTPRTCSVPVSRSYSHPTPYSDTRTIYSTQHSAWPHLPQIGIILWHAPARQSRKRERTIWM